MESKASGGINDRVPMNAKEYHALLYFAALMGCIDAINEELEKRWKMTEHGWRDAKMLDAVSQRLFRKILDTIPLDKLTKFRADAERAEIIFRVRPDITGSLPDGYMTLKVDEIERLCQHILKWECSMCGKKKGEIKACQIRKDLLDVFTYDLPADKYDCPFQDASYFKEELSDGREDNV